jgi:hypothetical protein
MVKRKSGVAQERKVEFFGSESVRPVYANFAQVQSTANDLKILFGEVVVSTPEEFKALEVARVYMTPRVAKALLGVLSIGIERWEAQNGPISLDPPSSTGKKQPA